MKNAIAAACLSATLLVGAAPTATAAVPRVAPQVSADLDRASAFKARCVAPFEGVYHAKKRNMWGQMVYSHSTAHRIHARNLGEFLCSSATMDYSQSLRSKHSAEMLRYVSMQYHIRNSNAKFAVSATSYAVASSVIDEASKLSSWSKVYSALRGAKKYGVLGWWHGKTVFQRATTAKALVDALR